jgi:hypothetical protein
MTLNQKYKASGSSLSFKNWIELQKQKGDVKFVNLDGNNETKTELSFAGVNLKYIGIAAIVLIAGGIIYSQLKKK